MSLPDTEPELVRAGPPPQPMPARPFTMRGFGLTDPGRVRPSNEDRFVVVELARTMHVHQTNVPQAKAQYSSHRGHLFLVADGMGGHQAGEVASALSVVSVEGFLLNTLKRLFSVDVPEEQGVLKEFQGALLQADARIFEEASRHPEMVGMGTTLTMAFAADWRLLLAHAGDSRCYLLSGAELHQLTQDHTVVAEMVRGGVLSPAEASRHPHRHVVTNVLGGYRTGRAGRYAQTRPGTGGRGAVVFGRPDGDGPGRPDRRHSSRGAGTPAGLRAAGGRGERPGRQGQHHGRRGLF